MVRIVASVLLMIVLLAILVLIISVAYAEGIKTTMENIKRLCSPATYNEVIDKLHADVNKEEKK